MRLREYSDENTYTAGDVVDGVHTNGRWNDPVVVKVGNEYLRVVDIESKLVGTGNKRQIVTIIHTDK